MATIFLVCPPLALSLRKEISVGLTYGYSTFNLLRGILPSGLDNDSFIILPVYDTSLGLKSNNQDVIQLKFQRSNKNSTFGIIATHLIFWGSKLFGQLTDNQCHGLVQSDPSLLQDKLSRQKVWCCFQALNCLLAADCC